MTSAISTPAAPSAAHLYSQAVRFGDLVFCSGQLPPSVESAGQLAVGDVEAQVRQVFTNLAAVLEAAGSLLDRVVKTTVFLTSMNDLAAINTVDAEHFPGVVPARSCIVVRALPHPDAPVEIEAIATRS